MVVLPFAGVLIGVLAIAVRAVLGSPVFFSQARAGFREQPITLVKFRTMLDLVDDEGVPLPDERRLTKLGKLLRASSLDELPSLWNVLRGDMSLVGPRPLFLHYVPRYSAEQRRRHEVRPGVTGWAQVNGRNALSWEEKFRLDGWYVDHVSFLLDVNILMRTVFSVFSRAGISASGHATMPEFLGTEATNAVDASGNPTNSGG